KNLTFAPRFILLSDQHVAGTADTVGGVMMRQSVPGYGLLNLSARYRFFKRYTVFANVTNALDTRYVTVPWGLDKNVKPTELFYGQPQDPLRASVGFNISF
ncbi:MAG TPA: hypothetical protein VEY71_11610, partial [Chitinophagales bacterium]|nr:hypothetical protein [Chitinophagales bacterium]